MKISNQNATGLTDADRLELARLLIKAGYTVRIGREKQGSKTIAFIETMEDKPNGNV